MDTCLIVEDNPVNAAVAKNIAMKLGFSCQMFAEGTPALEYCTRHLPALILLDGYMPGMNGLEFLRGLRALPGGSKPYVIFCSSSMDRDDVAEALSIGADCHIPKPLDFTRIAAALAQQKKASA